MTEMDIQNIKRLRDLLENELMVAGGGGKTG